MRIYVVGGAVRDQLLGRPVVDRDYVVVGATPEEMLAAGYLPVGKDFPVFLHPTTREEYALARTERKTAPGYGGFVFHTDPEVTLEEDLQRRDLTINAMAQTLDGAVLIDPCGGARDLEGRWFRHVGAAFVEDPVRLLRVGRFAARFDDFRTAPETQQLLMQMVANGEVDALVPERVWAEVSRGLMERSPSRMVSLLQGVGALQRIAPMAPSDAETLSALDRIALAEAPLAVRFAVWMVAGKLFVDDISALCAHLKTPVEMREYSVLLASLATSYHEQGEADANGVLFVLESSDALRRPERFGSVLKALEQLIGESASSGTSLAMFQARLERGLEVIRTIDNRKVAAAAQGADVAKAIHDARLAALTDALGRSGPGRRS